MMYSSMNLQAMYAGVDSKYIQNSSLKVFEEVLAFSFFFLFLKKALFLQQARKKDVLYLWRDSRLVVEGSPLSCSLQLKSWWQAEEREQSWWYSILTYHWRKSKDILAIPDWALTRDLRLRNGVW